MGEEIGRRTGKETRSLVLGHLQRGGPPTTFDRLLGTTNPMGSASIRLDLTDMPMPQGATAAVAGQSWSFQFWHRDGANPARFSTALEVTDGLDLTGRTMLVTGVTSGVGLEALRVLALRGAHVIGTGRTLARAREACASVGSGRSAPPRCCQRYT